mmetsp:Transcript_31009/g.35412  ORF Transcript_31009/g.35412 Transcript_31009/m.35412 type:complete len:148 (-) Transcript_31009:105-548(-)
MRSLAKEKLAHANTAFLMYENALRQTELLGNQLKPAKQISDAIPSTPKVNLAGGDNKSQKGSKAKKSTKSKKPGPAIKSEFLYVPIIPPVDEAMSDVEEEENANCYCGENKSDDWIGCDMASKCTREWFHLKCVNMDCLPADDELWF